VIEFATTMGETAEHNWCKIRWCASCSYRSTGPPPSYTKLL